MASTSSDGGMIKWPKNRTRARSDAEEKENCDVREKSIQKGLDNKCARLLRPGGCRHSWQLVHPPLLRQLTCCLSCPTGKKQKHIPSRETDYAHLISPTKLRQKKFRSRVSLKRTIAWDSRTREWICQLKRLRLRFFQPEIMLALFSKYTDLVRCIV